MADNKKKAPVKLIKKPYLRGKAYDASVIKSSLALFGSLFLVMFAFLLLGMMMIFDNKIISILLNLILLLGCYVVFYSSGMARGTTGVNQGEILYHREQIGTSYTQVERDACFHPAKGFIIGLLGTVPVFLVTLVFACITQRQMTSMGALPSWVSGLTSHEEVTAPVAYYTVTSGMTVTDILRVFVRMNVMPFVNMIGSTDLDAMLILERVSPVLVLLPGISYGIGYTRG